MKGRKFTSLWIISGALFRFLFCGSNGATAVSTHINHPIPKTSNPNTTFTIYDDEPICFDGFPVGTHKTISFPNDPCLSQYPTILLFITVDDVDEPEEATIQLNGHNLEWPITALGEGLHSGTISIDPSWLKTERNELRFSFDSTLGETTEGFQIIAPILFILVPKSDFHPGSEFDKEKAKIRWDKETCRADITNGRLELIVETQNGLNACHLRDRASGRIYADDRYIWPGGTLPELWNEPVATSLPEGDQTIVFNAKLNDLLITQQFILPQSETDVILEKITIANSGDDLLDTSTFSCGFAKYLHDKNGWDPDLLQSTFCFIPLRRYRGSKIRDFTVMDVLRKPYTAPAAYVPGWTSKVWGSESFGWTQSDNTLLITKYNNQDMEWTLLEVVGSEKQTAGKLFLRFGGCGLWKLGDPEGAASLKPGESFTFGITRLQALEGNWKKAFYAHRNFMDRQGHAAGADYDPPVIWNELFDNEFYFKMVAGPGYQPEFVKDLHEQYYTLDHMRREAAKARELGCECLYLDPGWDTGVCTTVWDERRLGTQKNFIKMLREEYGIEHLGLWCGLAHAPPGYSDPRPYGDQAGRRDENGKLIMHNWSDDPTDQNAVLPLICSYSPAYHDIKQRQLLTLAENRAKFLMYDGTQFTGVCYDVSHGHSIPLTRHEHILRYYELVKTVMEKYPHTLIELHDPITGPTETRYPPLYFCYGRPATFELWGYEYMWEPMENLLNGRASTLYYTNLGCNIPIYLHINLTKDNKNALAFWYYASLCRHLGVGGKHQDGRIWRAHIEAMKRYLRLKQFFTRGTFYGVDELTHVHTLSDEKAAVFVCFNLSEEPVKKTFCVKLSDIGLSKTLAYSLNGATSWKQDEGAISITIDLDGLDAGLIELTCLE